MTVASLYLYLSAWHLSYWLFIFIEKIFCLLEVETHSKVRTSSITSVFIFISISEEVSGPLQMDTEGKGGPKISRTFSYLRSKMSKKGKVRNVLHKVYKYVCTNSRNGLSRNKDASVSHRAVCYSSVHYIIEETGWNECLDFDFHL